MAHKIDSPAARAKLAPRRSPYWHKVQTNRFVGFRFLTEGKPGNWVAKVQDGRKETGQPLGKLEDVAEKDRFTVALRMAQRWFSELDAQSVGTDIVPSRITMRQVLLEYVKHLKASKGAEASEYARRRLDMIVVAYVDADGAEWIDRPLTKVKRVEFAAWRTWLSTLPVEKGKSAGKMRTGASVNRDMASFRAALNLAHRLHGIADVWKPALKRDLKADVAREASEGGVFLEIAERQAFLKAAQDLSPALVPLATMMCIAPIRPGALAAARVADYDAKTHSLFIRKDKVHAGRRVPMPPAAAKLLAQAVKGKLPAAHLFPDGKGREWNAYAWGQATKAAVAEAGLAPEVSLYWLRHSRITDLVEAGVSAIQIAATAGTSVAIIEKHYFQQRDEVVRNALAVAGH